MRTRTLALSKKSGASQSGFTLIELLVVLTVAATIGGLVGPNLWQSYQRASERLSVIDYARDITTIRRGLMQTRRSISISEDELSIARSIRGFPEIPAGWVVVANSELIFLPTGVTNGGQIAFESPTGRAWALNLGVLDGNISVELR